MSPDIEHNKNEINNILVFINRIHTPEINIKSDLFAGLIVVVKEQGQEQEICWDHKNGASVFTSIIQEQGQVEVKVEQKNRQKQIK